MKEHAPGPSGGPPVPRRCAVRRLVGRAGGDGRGLDGVGDRLHEIGRRVEQRAVILADDAPRLSAAKPRGPRAHSPQNGILCAAQTSKHLSAQAIMPAALRRSAATRAAIEKAKVWLNG